MSVPSSTSPPKSIPRIMHLRNLFKFLNPSASRSRSSTSFFKGASKFKISNSNFNEIQGNATIIRFGDGQFTEIQRNLICDYIANLVILPEINDNLKQHALTQSITTLPRAEAVFNDYQNKKKSGPCFKGTREGLLREMANWVTGSSESRMYILSGLAGIGKSTVAYTIAARTADLGILGASFFFSRDEADRNNAKKFFTTIAYQLCIYNETFSKAIGDALLTERGSAATTKDPQEQLQALILNPLRSIVQSCARPILIVVDALDECDEDDESAVVMGLTQLVRLMPSFKVILTTRPQPLVDFLVDNRDGYKIFYLQNIEDKVVDDDIRLYLSHSLSQEQVRARLLNPNEDWCASDEDIESLVRIAGRLFIIASTAVLFMLNKKLGDPGSRMKMLLGEIAQDRLPFRALDDFYSIIVRSAIQVDKDENIDDIVDRYQIVLGAIVALQTPLPVATLACFIGEETKNIYALLRNLQSVILLGSDDVPHIYHKSFPDYIRDQARCKVLRIDLATCHSQFVIRCFEIMDEHLKYNILSLSDPARFMSNVDGFKEDGITDEQLQEKIPRQLRYACVFWANHLEVANIEVGGVMNRLEDFVGKHMLHWFEVLSLIGKLDSAHRAIGVVLKLLNLAYSDLHELLSDALRFISKFYELIEQSALHMYYSALPFTPTDSLLYRRYIKEIVCGIDGGPEKWDALVANKNHGARVGTIKFSLENARFISCSETREYGIYRTRIRGTLKIWDAATGTPISTIPGQKFAVASNCSAVASSEDNIMTFYDISGSARSTTFTTPSEIQKLALSSEVSRVAVALLDGTVHLLNSINTQSICSFDGFEGSGYRPQLQFSPTGARLAYSSTNGIVKLWDGISGGFIADLQCGPQHDHYSGFVSFEFSGDGSQMVSRSYECRLMLWNCENGKLIGDASDVGPHGLAIAIDGSMLATSGRDKVQLWSRSCEPLAQIDVLGTSRLMAFSQDKILAIAIDSGIQLYNVKTCSFISTLPFIRGATALAFSPDSTRLAAGNEGGRVYLLDIRGVKVFSPPLTEKGTAIAELALSRDCLRLASGFRDGTIELWETNPKKQQIASHKGHKATVQALGFSPDGKLFASGLDDGTIELWIGGDEALRRTLKTTSGLQAVAVSSSMLAAACNRVGVTLWTLDTLGFIHTFEERDNIWSLSISDNSDLVAIAFNNIRRVKLFDVANRTTIATFDIPQWVYTMAFLPDNSHLVAQTYNGTFLSLNLTDRPTIKGPTFEHLIHFPIISSWRRVPIWYCWDKEQHHLAALFSQHQSSVPVLWIPRDLSVMKWTQGASTIALGCEDGHIILLRLCSTSR